MLCMGFINVRLDRHLVRSPSSGYHMNLFMIKTMDGVKVTICASMTSYANVPCMCSVGCVDRLGFGSFSISTVQVASDDRDLCDLG